MTLRQNGNGDFKLKVTEFKGQTLERLANLKESTERLEKKFDNLIAAVNTSMIENEKRISDMKEDIAKNSMIRSAVIAIIIGSLVSFTGFIINKLFLINEITKQILDKTH